MAQILVDGSQMLVFGETFPAQLLSSSGNGTGVDCSEAGANEMMAILSVNTVTAFTSLSVQLQESPDNATWTNIPTQLNQTGGNSIMTVTAANTQSQIPVALTVSTTSTSGAMRYIRGVATLVGTSCQMYCDIVFAKKYDQTNAFQNEPPTIN